MFATSRELGRAGRVRLVTSEVCVREALESLVRKRPDAVEDLWPVLPAGVFGTVVCVSRAVYVTALGPASGKSLVTLGLVELLSRRVSRLGFFRPLVHDGSDNDTELIRQREGDAQH